MNLSELEGKKLRIFVKGPKGETLGYTCEVLEVSENLIKVRDRFDEILFFHVTNILQIQPVNNGGNRR